VNRFWPIAVLCVAIADILLFGIFARLKTLGFEHPWLSLHDFRLYSTYWRLAPKLHQYVNESSVASKAQNLLRFFIEVPGRHMSGNPTNQVSGITSGLPVIRHNP
jgi:hypothetical protein